MRTYLGSFLADSGFRVINAGTGSESLKLIETTRPDLTVLDLGLPDIDGETVCKELKKTYPEMPVVILTAKGSPSDMARGLNIGADDYVAKPFSADVLMARINARLRDQKNGQKKITVGDLKMDINKHEVTRDGKMIELTQKEFELLEYLMSHKGQVLSRDMILNRVWEYTFDIESRVVDVYVGYLRKKVDSGYSIKLIDSIRGIGYILRDPQDK